MTTRKPARARTGYATSLRPGVYVTFGATRKEARALADVLGLALNDKKHTDKWRVVRVTVTEDKRAG